ncbi:MAG TPA: peptidylprolyl isomerase, partial [Spongiibacteraceae bacterium]|nr:peptidylprolyl isomerase [Spongiibacteraceae bacterium]
LYSELQDAVQRAEFNAKRAKRELPPADQFRRQVFDQLVLDSLQLQIANRAGVRISDAELNEAMERVARQNNMTLEQFSQALTKDGLPYAVAREQLRKEMLIQRVQQGSVNEHVQITDQEIDSFLNSAEGRAMTSPQYHVLHALIPTSEKTDKAQIKQFAEQLAARLRAGEDFNKVIATAGPVPVQGGDLGWRSDESLPSLLADVVPSLKAGQVADPIASSSGYHLVKLAEVRGKGEVIRQTKARHILLKPSAIRSDEQCKQLANDLRQRAIGGADFGQLARQYSEDIGSAMEGGELGWTSPGQLVEAFQKAMDNTVPGTISEPFRSRYGWHIVLVEERRQQDVTTELRQNMARNYLHEKKYQDELDGWLRKIRDEAYVDIKKI